MTPSARLSAAITVLDAILAGQTAEGALTAWGRASRFAGSGDRHAVRDLVFDALRCKRSFAAQGGGMTGRGLILGGLRAGGADVAAIEALFNGQGHAPHGIGPADEARRPVAGEAMDLPDWLLPELARSVADVGQFAAALIARAPVFLRVNRAKTTLLALQTELAAHGVQTQLVPYLQDALQVVDGARKLSATNALQHGLAELQDAASQSIVAAISLPKSGRILDFCAGGGGKTLNIAAQLSDSKSVILQAYDALPRRMIDLPARAARANAAVQILQTLPDFSDFGTKTNGYDLILTDVPCSGSGSWRRDPMGKWALTAQKLDEVLALQARILDQAAAMVSPSGQLAYSTCSVLNCENEDQIASFLQRNSRFKCRKMQRFGLGNLAQDTTGGDGFFLAIMNRISTNG
ncbi:MAG: RsmB/NOP family class I SAM-dependent RNA methyltransferase [Cypionkella sp.]|nr:RsmB/NOP family class I SAM-dependent RNA methyltransferase [Cypionkella sp.]